MLSFESVFQILLWDEVPRLLRGRQDHWSCENKKISFSSISAFTSLGDLRLLCFPLGIHSAPREIYGFSVFPAGASTQQRWRWRTFLAFPRCEHISLRCQTSFLNTRHLDLLPRPVCVLRDQQSIKPLLAYSQRAKRSTGLAPILLSANWNQGL